MDADLSHHPKYLRQHIERLRKGVDLSVGSRYVHGGGVKNWGWNRIMLSRLGNFTNRVVLSPKLHDYTGGFNGLSLQTMKFVVRKDVVASSGYYFLTEMKYRILQKGFTYEEFPIIFEDRTLGSSKMGKSIITEAFKQLFAIRFRKIQ